MNLSFQRPVWASLVFLTLALSAAAQTPTDESWTALKTGVAEKSTEQRAIAVGVLGLLVHSPEAQEMATTALADEKPEVRASAAQALGQMGAKSATPKLRQIILGNEKDVGVILACAHSLIQLGDNRGYNVYYAILTGERKTGAGLLADQKKMLHDPKKMAEFGFEQGIGFIPFAGLGWNAFKMLDKDDVSPVRAAAARTLAKDPDPKSREALVAAASDKSWLVRTAALESLALRGDPSVIGKIAPALDDQKPEVHYTAAAAIIRLSQKKP